ncbi:MAG: TetR family transcriptional regulator [Armatimonadetes bacterium]|nr:TetR family transcriptional regulator [Armatimonadota bacterium]
MDIEKADTKERLLDAAERLFAERGVQETSVREITARAGANLAAVNYHFGSKDDLILAVIARRLGPLNEERLCLLDACEIPGSPLNLTLERALDSFIAPAIRLYLKHPYFMRLAGRIVFTADTQLRRLYITQFEKVYMKMRDLLAKLLPDLPKTELLWRIHFLLGAMINTHTNHADLYELSRGRCGIESVQRVADRLVAFCAAGFRAPVPTHNYPETGEWNDANASPTGGEG